MSDALATVQAAMAAHQDKFVSPAAAEQFATLVAAKFGGADASALPGAVAAAIGHAEYAHFLKGPAPGSLAHAAAAMATARSEAGGLPGVTQDGQKYDLSPSWRSPAEHATGEARGVVNQELADLAAFAGRPGASWNDLSSAERLLALGERHRQARASQSGLVVRPSGQ